MLQFLNRTALLLCPLALVACGDDSSPEDSTDSGATDVADSGDTPTDTGADTGEVSLCDPTPQRCDGLGTDQPPRTSEHGAAYSSDTAEMIVFGGTTGVPENCDPSVAAAYVGDTWIYDDACGAWTSVSGNGPTARGRHAMAGSNDGAWVFGGRWRADGRTSGDYTLYDELWHFDTVSRTWELASTGGPAARTNSVLVWDSTAERLLLFGGNDSESGMNIGPLNDVWEFDPASGSWSELSPSGTAPAPRLSAAGLYDASRHRLVLYGGFDTFDFGGGVDYFSDVWALDLNTMTWEQLANEVGGPDGRFGSSMMYDVEFDNYMLFGGHDDQALGNRNDNWLFFPSNNTWGQLGLGDTFNSPQIGVCEFPPDFTTIDPALPERRTYHTIVWSETCNRGLMFGGKTDCGSANDVWSYADEAWTEEVVATAGEVCVRFRNNPENCVNLCF